VTEGDAGFWAMGGYALYVWGSFGITALVFVWNLLTPGARRRRIIRELNEEAEEQ